MNEMKECDFCIKRCVNICLTARVNENRIQSIMKSVHGVCGLFAGRWSNKIWLDSWMAIGGCDDECVSMVENSVHFIQKIVHGSMELSMWLNIVHICMHARVRHTLLRLWSCPWCSRNAYDKNPIKLLLDTFARLRLPESWPAIRFSQSWNIAIQFIFEWIWMRACKCKHQSWAVLKRGQCMHTCWYYLVMLWLCANKLLLFTITVFTRTHVLILMAAQLLLLAVVRDEWIHRFPDIIASSSSVSIAVEIELFAIYLALSHTQFNRIFLLFYFFWIE